MRELTVRQAELLGHIKAAVQRNGYAPSLREMMAAMKIGSTNGVVEHLIALEKKGAIVRDKHRARCIVVVDSDASSSAKLDAVLRAVRALTEHERIQLVRMLMAKWSDDEPATAPMENAGAEGMMS